MLSDKEKDDIAGGETVTDERLEKSDSKRTKSGQDQDKPRRPWERLEPVPRPSSWTQEWVEYRLVHAFATLLKLPGRIGPKEFGNAWPEVLHTRGDLVQQYLSGAAQADFARPDKGATLQEVTWMDEALAWPGEYLVHDDLALRAVMMWAHRTAKGHNRRIVPSRLGASRSTCWAARQRGVNWIANRLASDGVIVSGPPSYEPEFCARL